MSKLFVISVGGSLINPGEINVSFLKKFRDLIISQTKKGNRFILVAGGGRPAREYQAALKKINPTALENVDWIGIYATRLNANLLILIFKGICNKDIVTNFESRVMMQKPIVVAGGWKPGRSSDGATVKLAKLYNAHSVINLSNIDYVYTKDPRKFKDAKKIWEISWKEFIKIVGSKWNPGANVPFDPTAAQFAQKNKLKVIITNGKNLKNLEDILKGKSFIGTTVN